MEAIELRKKTDELEKSIKNLIDKFIADEGPCEIDVRTKVIFVETLGSTAKELFDTEVRVNVTV
jgi:hypothetical protein